jgi:hypothetical protein
MLDPRTILTYAAGAALVVAMAGWGTQTVRLADLRTEMSELRESYAEAGRIAEKGERETERTWRERIDKEATHAQTKINALAVDLATARTAAKRLQDAAASTARRIREATTIADTGPRDTGPDPLDLLVGVLQRHSDELVGVGEYADRLMVAGSACERSYDALTR